MKRFTLAAIILTGCEAFVPNSNAKPVPKPAVIPTQEPQRIEIVVRVDGEGRVTVASEKVKAAAHCECGCGKDGCSCNPRDLSSGPRKEAAPTHAGTAAAGVLNSITVISPASFRCDACDLAVRSLRALGANVEHVKQDGFALYPVITNAHGKEYKLSDGYWRVGRDDVAAIKELTK